MSEREQSIDSPNKDLSQPNRKFLPKQSRSKRKKKKQCFARQSIPKEPKTMSTLCAMLRPNASKIVSCLSFQFSKFKSHSQASHIPFHIYIPFSQLVGAFSPKHFLLLYQLPPVMFSSDQITESTPSPSA